VEGERENRDIPLSCQEKIEWRDTEKSSTTSERTFALVSAWHWRQYFSVFIAEDLDTPAPGINNPVFRRSALLINPVPGTQIIIDGCRG